MSGSHDQGSGAKATDTAVAPYPLLALWIARMGVRSGGASAFFGGEDVGARRVQAFLDPSRETASARALLDDLQTELVRLEAAAPGYGAPLEGKAEELRRLFGLSEDECRILVFLAFASRGTGSVISDAFALTLQVAGRDAVSVMATALDLEEASVAEALDPAGRLLRSGLVHTVYEDRHSPRDVFYNESEVKALTGLLRALLSRRYSLACFFERFVQPADEGGTEDLDFTHIATDYAQLRQLLATSIGEGPTRLNMLITGEPGVGKTALAHRLGHELGLACFGVPAQDDAHHSIDGPKRFHKAQIAQALLAGRRDALLIFDEIEDVLGAGGRPEAQVGKGWANRLLEGTPVPTVWIANSVRRVDRAHLRRFDYVLELRNPPRSTRKRLLQRALAQAAVSQGWLEAQAANEALTPAQIHQLGQLARRVDARTERETVEHLLEGQLHRQQRLQGQAAAATRVPTESPLPYALAHISADPEPTILLSGLARRGTGRLLLHGPPGTGKTVFADVIAEELDRPLLARKASDLLSCLVGESERLLAAVFTEARETQAVLFVDEVDSFLGHRDEAHHGWQITMANELLAQLDAHRGIVVMATNRIDAIDAAAIRRFDVRMGFAYPHAEARWQLFEHLLETLGVGALSTTACRALRPRLNRLEGLTPGDFATVARRLTLLGDDVPDTETVVAALTDEWATRPRGASIGPGFV